MCLKIYVDHAPMAWSWSAMDLMRKGGKDYLAIKFLAQARQLLLIVGPPIVIYGGCVRGWSQRVDGEIARYEKYEYRQGWDN